MSFIRLIAGRRFFVCAVFGAALLAPGLIAPVSAQSDNQFPFDQELLLETPPMRPGKRMPSLTVERNGNAIIDLWCKSVPARVELSETTIKLEAAPLPDELPQMQSAGQCAPERMAADGALLEKLTQVTSWIRQGGILVLDGPTPMRFRAGTN
jgi:heat shock protein HslJ